MKDLVWKLMETALKGNDEISTELAQDMAKAACRYARFRMDWNFWTNEERAEQDSYRTSAHNRFMDTLKIFLRYEAGKGTEVPDIQGCDRKELGDLACYLAYLLGLEAR